MLQIFKNLKKYWYWVLIIIGLLVVQAFCDLALPDYTADIIDVGINNKGVEHAVPEYITEEGYYSIAAFLTEDEIPGWMTAYEVDTEHNCLKLTSDAKSKWDNLDEKYAEPIAILFMISQAPDEEAEHPTEMPMEDEMSMDMESPMLAVREMMHEELSAIGDTIIFSMAKQYAVLQYEACGININKIQKRYMWSMGFKMIGMTLIMVIIAITVGFIASRISAGVGRDLRGKVFRKVIGFSNAEIDRFSTASLITRSTNDVQQIQLVTVFILRMILYAPILAIGGIINIRHYNSGMSWIIFLAILLVLIQISSLMIFAMPKFRIMQDMVDRVNLVAREILTGLPVIRAFSREKREEERFDEANKDLTKTMLFTNRAMSFMMPVLMVIMNGTTILIVWVASKKIDSGVIQVGDMMAFITYAILIIMSFLMMTAISIMLPRAGVAANRIKAVLETEDVIVNADNAITKKAERGEVAFNNVSFRYPDGEENVIEGIDFVAKPGETTAIIGSTGSGKSTIVKLIPRFFDVSEGSITVDGDDVRQIDIKTLRGQIGFVPQKGVLFSGDINSNIGYGTDDLSEENIKLAAEIAQATEFIEDKPDKYESQISQGGSNVSGGQKQRLSIARAIARKPKIFVFDDSFSALDFKTDAKLRAALKEHIADATVFIVAQRVSTILNAEQIIVLEDGKMVGKGTHKELAKSCETYIQIAQSQMTEEEFAASLLDDAETTGKGEI